LAYAVEEESQDVELEVVVDGQYIFYLAWVGGHAISLQLTIRLYAASTNVDSQKSTAYLIFRRYVLYKNGFNLVHIYLYSFSIAPVLLGKICYLVPAARYSERPGFISRHPGVLIILHRPDPEGQKKLKKGLNPLQNPHRQQDREWCMPNIT
jgi:hypothetical protein